MIAAPIGKLKVIKANNEKYWYADFIGHKYFILADEGSRWHIMHRFGTDAAETAYYVDKDDAQLLALIPREER